MTPTCSTCRYFVPDEEDDLMEYEDGEEPSPVVLDTGTCHRHAPEPVMACFLPATVTTPRWNREGNEIEPDVDEPNTEAIWPAVDASDFCGEFRMIDRKVKK